MKSLSAFFLIAFLLFLVGGCATTQQPAAPSEQPELVAMTSLPPVSSMYPASGLKLKMLFHVRSDGSVMEVKMMNSSGDPDWDKGAVDSMKKWQFAAFPASNASPDKWVRNTVILQVQAPTVLTLGELAAGNQQMADSLKTLLEGGSDFDALMKHVAPGAAGPMGRFLGEVDIARFPQHVRDALRKIGLNETTQPLRVGTKYIIYKRYKPDGLLDSPQ